VDHTKNPPINQPMQKTNMLPPSNDNHALIDKLIERIDQLEIKLAFQDDLIDQLNTIVTSQNTELSQLKNHYQLINQQLRVIQYERQGGTEENEPPPPHY
jgi:SlyX protein